MLSLDIKMPDPGERGASQLPQPSGFKLLIALPELEEKTDSGIYLPEQLREKESLATVVGFVLKMGSLAYKDPTKFQDGPWCKEGDWVLFRAYSGTRIKIHGREFRIINDDTVEAVVEDPRGITRV
ncbi:GroS Co-chaperonin GroES (HSP10) [uncultured Caudovirales phage]|uniref:GroS Co-chaperonin GroES (HSP10) n=1 Tax=uncultured Caudovirales phage TaxID=2100421 RepID=A0A6J5QAH1_9CAUD|nr:GroS Co-chaperonin GroES (HSP10) [uncultured Caudovirales phage]CAB4181710.1 GroS Co-chaperonin GroES (HSP10) [uncultured Caudovirales phage]CAB4195655.1 GroS Co-chaperonin GroES (HSP10) [uncultured Caudovirales phage]CAB4211648.1 GroS Co-chaperonin GroES (HSP10) [uncultured Caudovirales phage]